MAKRRKLTAPSPEDLTRLEGEFRGETPPVSSRAPIAQVAAEAALAAPVLDVQSRADAARDKVDAEAWRDGLVNGLVIHEIPLDQIDPEDMVRDRAGLDEERMTELRLSISENGLRLPIEVYARDVPEGEPPYGVLSGYRRYCAYRGLLGLTGQEQYRTIRALIRQPASVPDAFVAMVEENEIRADLSHFERGRIVSIAVQTGVFASVEEAVNRLFSAASKAKRSKIRSFALIFAEMGDLLAFPDALTEKQGLRLASVLRAGREAELRGALDPEPLDAASEWRALEQVIRSFEDSARDPGRGGRPRKAAPQSAPQPVPQPAPQPASQPGTRPDMRHWGDVALRQDQDAEGHLIRVSGPKVTSAVVRDLMREITRLLDQT